MPFRVYVCGSVLVFFFLATARQYRRLPIQTLIRRYSPNSGV